MAAPGQVRRIEVHLGPLDPGLRDAEPTDTAVEAIGHEHRARIGKHAETAWSVDFGRIGRAGVTLEPAASDAAQGRDRLAGDVDAADAVVEIVGDIDVALINRGAPGTVEVGLRHAAVAEARGSISGDCLDHVGRLRIGANRADPPDPVVEAVGDVEIRRCGGIDRDAIGEIQIGLARVTILATEAEPARAGYREDRAHRQYPAVAIEAQAADDFADPAVVRVRDEEVACRVDREPRRITQRGLPRRLALIGAGIARGSSAGDRRHGLMGHVDRPDDVVEGIRDIKHIARGVESSTHRVCQACAGRLARGQPRTSRATDSGQGADVAVGGKGAHRVVEGVNDVALAGHGRDRRVQLFRRRDL